MKPDQIYQSLTELAEKLNVKVSEKNLQAGIRAKSGLCKVKGEYLFLLEKRKSIAEKIDILLEGLGRMPHEDVYVVPAIRDLLKQVASKDSGDSDENKRAEGG